MKQLTDYVSTSGCKLSVHWHGWTLHTASLRGADSTNHDLKPFFLTSSNRVYVWISKVGLGRWHINFDRGCKRFKLLRGIIHTVAANQDPLGLIEVQVQTVVR